MTYQVEKEVTRVERWDKHITFQVDKEVTRVERWDKHIL